jgi:hypothetical protein
MNCGAPATAGSDTAGDGAGVWRDGVAAGLPRGGAVGALGVVLQAARENATSAREASKLLRVNDMGNRMWVLILEAIAAFFSLVFIVWWTMYCGRPEMKKPAQTEDGAPASSESVQETGKS